MSENNENELKRKLSIIISITTLFIPVLYLIGYFYHLGNLTGFETEIEFFPKTIQDYLVYSFFIFIKIVSNLISFTTENYWVVIVYALILSIFAWYQKTKKSKVHREYIDNQTKKITQSKFYENWSSSIIILVIVSIMPFLIVVVLSVLSLLPFSSYWVGKSEALKVVNEFQGCQAVKSSCSYVYEGKKKVLEGIFVAKSSEYIAIWNGTETVKYPLGKLTVISKKLTKKDTSK